MRNTVLATLIQLVLGSVIVFVGWEVLYSILKPTSKNWMWVSEMKMSFALLAVSIIVGNLITMKGKRYRMFSLVIQFILVLNYSISKFNIFPNRSMFLLAAYTMVILSIFPIEALLRKMRSGEKPGKK